MALLLIAFITVLVGILLLPGLMALGNGYAAKQGTADTVTALRSGDFDEARESLADVRDDIEDMQRATTGLTGTIWGWLPGGDTDRADIVHLAQALGELTAVVETAVEVYPEDSAADGFLIGDDGRIDVAGLTAVLAETDEILGLVGDARNDLDLVTGEGFYGLPIAFARDAALDRVEPLDAGLRLAEPLLPFLPRLLGAGGPQAYLVALLNPAEQRFSGGATLTFAPLFVSDGKVTKGQPLSSTTDPGAFGKLRWAPVKGNPFHLKGKAMRLSTAALAPSWSVAGEELARAWEELRSTPIQGVIAFDVVALQELMRHTGPIEVPGYGELDETNLVEKLVGSYEDYTSTDQFLERRTGAQSLMANFQARMMSPARVPQKLVSLIASAKGRHVAVHFRSATLQKAFDEIGLGGDLSPTTYDYIGVFNQATSGHKADYWQRRSVATDVRLAEDGSARVRMEIEFFNDSPPAAEDVPPSFQNYVRRENDTSLAAFLPTGTQVRAAELDGTPLDLETEDFYDRPFVRTRFTADPGATRRLVLRYDVPHAAVPRPDSVTYRLDIDPQGMVDPQAVDVTVHWPRGYTADELPDDWTATEDGAHFTTEDLTTSPRWEILASRSS